MKVKIGNKIYDSTKEPIMLILKDADKQNIANMAPHATMYCEAPDGTPIDEIELFMSIEEEN